MKKNCPKYYATIFTFLNIVEMYAGKGGGSNPPSPTGKTVDSPPPPGFPIDDNFLFVLIFALLYAFYLISKYSIKQKA